MQIEPVVKITCQFPNHSRGSYTIDDHICDKLLVRHRFLPIFTGACEKDHEKERAQGMKERFHDHSGLIVLKAENKKI